jgi:hypothetical protein
MEYEHRKEAYEFAKACWEQKEEMLKMYFSDDPNNPHKAFCNILISKLDLPKEKKDLLYEIIDTALTDTFYTLLLALDGCAAIGSSGMQQMYKIITEDDVLISECGDLEAAAYTWFHDTPKE